jgi:GTP cyclohydrolase I
MKRPQIQEELTKQIADYCEKMLKPKGLAVFIKASHLCMIARGVEEKQGSEMKTSVLRGSFRDSEARHEFFSMVNNGGGK